MEKRTYRKSAHPTCGGGYQGYEETDISDTLNIYDISEGRTPILVVEKQKEPIAFTTEMTPKVDGGVRLLVTEQRLQRSTMRSD